MSQALEAAQWIRFTSAAAGHMPTLAAMAAAASLKLLLEVTEICDVSEDRREWPLCIELIDFTSVSISLE